jgi:chitinase
LSYTDQDQDFYEALAKGVAELLLSIAGDVDQVELVELDEAYAERLVRDIKASGFDKLVELVEGLF